MMLLSCVQAWSYRLKILWENFVTCRLFSSNHSNLAGIWLIELIIAWALILRSMVTEFSPRSRRRTCCSMSTRMCRLLTAIGSAAAVCLRLRGATSCLCAIGPVGLPISMSFPLRFSRDSYLEVSSMLSSLTVFVCLPCVQLTHALQLMLHLCCLRSARLPRSRSLSARSSVVSLARLSCGTSALATALAARS